MEFATLHMPVTCDRDVIPPAARDLISALLARDPRTRLGHSGGASEIRRHPYFKGIKWNKLRAKRLPAPLDVTTLIQEADARRPTAAAKRRKSRLKEIGRWDMKYDHTSSAPLVSEQRLHY